MLQQFVVREEGECVLSSCNWSTITLSADQWHNVWWQVCNEGSFITWHNEYISHNGKEGSRENEIEAWIWGHLWIPYREESLLL